MPPFCEEHQCFYTYVTGQASFCQKCRDGEPAVPRPEAERVQPDAAAIENDHTPASAYPARYYPPQEPCSVCGVDKRAHDIQTQLHMFSPAADLCEGCGEPSTRETDDMVKVCESCWSDALVEAPPEPSAQPAGSAPTAQFNSQLQGEQPESMDDNLRWWNAVHACLEEWQKVWLADRTKYDDAYPKWMVNAAQELFAHDMCDKWSWNDYVKAATVILARHYPAAPANLDSVVAEYAAKKMFEYVAYSVYRDQQFRAIIRKAVEEVVGK